MHLFFTLRAAPFALSLIFVVLLSPSTAFCAFGDYSLDFYGGLNWEKNSYEGVEPEYDTGNFWIHDYYNAKTHNGEDYRVGPNSAPYSPVYSPGYGLFSGTVGGTYGLITIQHLLDCGEKIRVNLLHSQLIESDVIAGNYVAFGQKLAIEGKEGTGAYHLHVEYSNQSVPHFLPSSTATPRSKAERDSIVFLDDLKAHYDTARPDRKFYIPKEVTTKYKELLPHLSRSQNPSFDNYDVYGIEGKPLYGAMTLGRKKSAKSFYAIGIISRYDLSRGTETPVTEEDGKWLAQSWEKEKSWNNRLPSDTITLQPNIPITFSGSNNYKENDYKFKAFVASDENNVVMGYPVTFTVLPNSASVLVDNDQRNSGDYKFVYFDNSTYGTADYNIGEENHKVVPGYYMSALLAKPKTGSFAQWYPGKAGKYEIYVHVPEGASGLVEYKIKEDGVLSVKSELVDHAAHQGEWVKLKVDQKDKFKFTSAGYVGISLAADANVAVMADQFVGIDAVKFVSSSFNMSPIYSLLLDEEESQSLSQREALMAFYNATGGDNWVDSAGWGGSDDISTWSGVSCDQNGNVDSLSLVSRGLTGSIPPEIGNLTNLTTLYLSSNQLTGSIPPEIGNLTNLSIVDLDSNQLTGSIPPEIGNLTNLIFLDLGSNQLAGSIPPEIGNLTILTTLALSSNLLTGSIPPEIGNLTNLSIVDLDSNLLTGSIPPEIGNLTNLSTVDLDSNQLAGSIPPEIGNLTNLIWLDLYSNQLAGSIPPEIGNLTNLTRLALSYNQLTGSIPSGVGNLTNLTTLYLGSNQLTGSIPETFVNLTNIGNVNSLWLDIAEFDWQSASPELLQYLEDKGVVVP